VKFLSNDYTNPNANPRTLTTLTLTLTNLPDAFKSFYEPVFCDFIRNYIGVQTRTSSHFDKGISSKLLLVYTQGDNGSVKSNGELIIYNLLYEENSSIFSDAETPMLGQPLSK